jgi:hypothetical protein
MVSEHTAREISKTPTIKKTKDTILGTSLNFYSSDNVKGGTVIRAHKVCFSDKLPCIKIINLHSPQNLVIWQYQIIF